MECKLARELVEITVEMTKIYQVEYDHVRDQAKMLCAYIFENCNKGEVKVGTQERNNDNTTSRKASPPPMPSTSTPSTSKVPSSSKAVWSTPQLPEFPSSSKAVSSSSKRMPSSLEAVPSSSKTVPLTALKEEKLLFKRKVKEDICFELSAKAVKQRKLQQHKKLDEEEYPKQIGNNIILGPNGTAIDVNCYNSVNWSSAVCATRQLLGRVFGDLILATHTLSGKPSPAFYGRERAPKMKLDAAKAADIIHIVRSKCKCDEREIRATITSKCADASKKYKRLQQKK